MTFLRSTRRARPGLAPLLLAGAALAPFAVFAGCSSVEGGCTKDADCATGRVCEAGTCVNASTTSTATGSGATGSTGAGGMTASTAASTGTGMGCDDGLTSCNGTCVDLESAPGHCGACGKACGADQLCTAGACKSKCDDGLTTCSGACVDIGKDEANCGACGKACGADQLCSAGACKLPASCKALLDAKPGTPSGNYTIDPDGAGPVAPVLVGCDMVTNGGGWTVVFLWSAETNSTALSYGFTGATSVVSQALEMMVAHRDTNSAPTGDYAVIGIAKEWNTLSPFSYQTGEAYVPASTYNSAGKLLNQVALSKVYFGYSDFNEMCGKGTWATFQTRGQFCVADVLAPAFNNFAQPQADSCVATGGNVYKPSCSSALRFSLAVR